MSLLTVIGPAGHRSIEIPPGQSVRDALDLTELRVRAACGGTGSCGACVVRCIDGEVTPLTGAEHLKLSREDRAQGLRLACQLRLRAAATIRLEHPAAPSPWRSIPPDELSALPNTRSGLHRNTYALAVDLGTTHLRIALWDRRAGVRIAARTGPNPQGDFGADVLNRLAAAQRSSAHAVELARLARTAIMEATHDMLARDVGEVKPMLAKIGALLVVGNTAMLTLLTGRDAAALLNPDGWDRRLDCTPTDAQAWRDAWALPDAAIETLPPLGGFVGSDLIADVIAAGLTRTSEPALLIDVGTNSEVALWDGAQLHVTSVPGGPAFEAVGVRCGMSAEAGAIQRVQDPGDTLLLDVIGGDAPRGFCGSGLIDAIAALRQRGVLKRSGRFAVPVSTEGHLLQPGNPRTAITASDVDALQRAKAALAAATLMLLNAASLQPLQLARVVICGAFGHHLHIQHAQALGLLPPLDPRRFELFPNAALAGCEMALLDPARHAEALRLARAARLVNLSAADEFDRLFIEQLPLQPFSAQSR